MRLLKLNPVAGPKKKALKVNNFLNKYVTKTAHGLIGAAAVAKRPGVIMSLARAFQGRAISPVVSQYMRSTFS